jgi:hypothetical protein
MLEGKLNKVMGKEGSNSLLAKFLQMLSSNFIQCCLCRQKKTG